MRAPLKTTMVSWTPSLNIFFYFIFSDDHNRVLLKETASATGSDYINASYIVSDQTPNFPVSFIHLLHSYNKVIQNIETCKEFWIHTSNLVCGEGGKVGHLWFKRRSTNIVQRHFSVIVGVGTIPTIPPLLQDYGHKKLHLSQKQPLPLCQAPDPPCLFIRIYHGVIHHSMFEILLFHQDFGNGWLALFYCVVYSHCMWLSTDGPWSQESFLHCNTGTPSSNSVRFLAGRVLCYEHCKF